MSTALLLPRLGETMEQGRVVAWLKRPGDAFVRGETLVEIETDKTVVELPALADGVLRRIDAEVGTDVDVGASLGAYDTIGAEDDAAPDDAPAAAAAVAPAPAPVATPVAAPPPVARSADAPVRATPNARRLARAGGVDLAAIAGTGRRARVQGVDVQATLGGKGGFEVAVPAGVLTHALPAGKLAYREWPGGSTVAPIVLVHGYAGDSQAWAVLASALQRAGRRVLAIDLPSHGATDFDRVEPVAMAEALVAFLDAKVPGKIELVGHSLGAVVATQAAAALGARVERLTLIAPAGLGSEIDADFIDGMAHVAHGGGLAHLLRRIALDPPPLSSAQLDEMARQIRVRDALPALARHLVAHGRQQLDLVAALAPLATRARLVWGLADQIIPWHHATRAGPGIPVFFIPHAGHMPHWDQPQKVAALFA